MSLKLVEAVRKAETQRPEWRARGVGNRSARRRCSFPRKREEEIGASDQRVLFCRAGQGPLLISETRVEVDYLTTLAGNNYATDTDIHLRSLPTSEQVYAGNSTIPSAETQYENDNYNQNTSDVFHASVMNRVSISGLDGSFTTTHYTRGNLTKSTRAVAFDTNGNITASISAYTHYERRTR